MRSNLCNQTFMEIWNKEKQDPKTAVGINIPVEASP